MSTDFSYDSCHHSEVVIHWELIWRNQPLRTLLQLKYKLYNRRALYHKMRDMRLHFLLRSVWQDNNAYIYILLFSPNIKLSFQIESQNLQHLQATTSNSDSMALCVCARDFFYIFLLKTMQCDIFSRKVHFQIQHVHHSIVIEVRTPRKSRAFCIQIERATNWKVSLKTVI